MRLPQAVALTENISHSTVVADKGYDSNAFVAALQSKGCTVLFHQNVTEKYKGHMISIFTKSVT